MLHRKIVLAGGNGYLGGVLAHYYSTRAEKVIILSRKAAPPQGNIHTVAWDGCNGGEWQEALEKADLLINLCGKNVNCRYNPRNREEILQSRIIPTRALSKAALACKQPPQLWINVTSATIYRHAEDRPQDEYTGEEGYGFSVDICKAWEQAFFETPLPATRRVALRMGIVLGRNGGVFPRLLNLVKAGMGGRQGNGAQYVSWVHEQDVAACTEWLLQRSDMEGVINCTAPEPVANHTLMETFRTAWGTPLGLPAPLWLLQCGAWLIGTETELIVKSRWVTPARLLAAGFSFRFRVAAHAINDILSIRL
ncbi:hypothetical protein HNQ91_001399 [Filimonas zeae]|uniref:NAD-dependent epimerase n=1 Tax=Filimonas zeae TaxID=1737353 RepID=A0A917MW65_9BACT|nr:TIGR01777 family oxidoreductase [Filimonas zeae]MDR6338348.1 hypothetical protein [Filimonas zeae]GGH68680.1 NAD-dependent epimerase [Filimonas zeae]